MNISTKVLELTRERLASSITLSLSGHVHVSSVRISPDLSARKMNPTHHPHLREIIPTVSAESGPL